MSVDDNERARMHQPYFSHNFCKEVHVLLGFMSRMFPNKGTPGGCGIGVDMVVSAVGSISAVEIL